jgi:hypothetical protein
MVKVYNFFLHTNTNTAALYFKMEGVVEMIIVLNKYHYIYHLIFLYTYLVSNIPIFYKFLSNFRCFD